MFLRGVLSRKVHFSLGKCFKLSTEPSINLNLPNTNCYDSLVAMKYNAIRGGDI